MRSLDRRIQCVVVSPPPGALVRLADTDARAQALAGRGVASRVALAARLLVDRVAASSAPSLVLHARSTTAWATSAVRAARRAARVELPLDSARARAISERPARRDARTGSRSRFRSHQ